MVDPTGKEVGYDQEGEFWCVRSSQLCVVLGRECRWYGPNVFLCDYTLSLSTPR
jgi:hypothetical protein